MGMKRESLFGFLLAPLLLFFPCITAHAAIADVTVGPGGAFVFSPVDIIIDVGDTVKWTWDSTGHNVGSGLPGSPTSAFLSGPPVTTLPATFSVVFDQAFLDANPVLNNIYDYHCHPHGSSFNMVGSVEVIPEPTTISLLGFGAVMLRRKRS
jgi:plastocyanin